MPTPVQSIDISPFFTGDPAARRAVAAQIGRACEEIGFLTITGHGVAPDLIEEMAAISRRFFDLPVDEKMRAPVNTAGALDLGPEGIHFIKAQDSPTGFPLLAVANEVSGTTTIYGFTCENWEDDEEE